MGKVGNHRISQDEQNQRYLEERKSHYASVVKKLTIMDDVFMRNVLKKQKCTEYILQIIMGEKNLRVIDQVLQKDYKNLQGKSAILDCVAVNAEGKEINVTSKEFDLLGLLATNVGKVYSRDELLRLVWGTHFPGDARTVDVHVRRLREKIEKNPAQPQYVHTKWGMGYFFQG